MILYGSRVSGTASEDGDYDVLVVVEDRALLQTRRKRAADLASATGLPVDLNLATPHGLETRSLLDPYIQYVLATGVQVGEQIVEVGPLSRQGIQDALICVELGLQDLHGVEGAEVTTSMLRRAAKQLAVLSQAVDGRYSAQEYAQVVAGILAQPVRASVAMMSRMVEVLRLRLVRVPANAGDEALVRYVARERHRLHEQAH